jgi:hypothetical protein
MHPISMKCSGFRHVSILLICVGALFAGRASNANDEPTSDTIEPQPPNILEIVQVAGAAGDKIVTVDAIVRPVVDGEVELQVLSPAGLRFAGRDRSRRFRIQRGGRVHSERLLVKTSPLHPTVVRIRANLSNADGEVWLSVDRELRFNERGPDPSRVRIPVVRTAPDGSRTVEYMERREAERRGLQPEGKQKPDADEPDRQSPTASSLDDDVPATPVVQE